MNVETFDNIEHESKGVQKEFMLTTVDNPFDPFTQFDDWFAFDQSNGYYCCEYLDRIANTSEFLSDELNNKEIERAIDEIIWYNPLMGYKKVERIL